jgi:hypothetical protein
MKAGSGSSRSLDGTVVVVSCPKPPTSRLADRDASDSPPGRTGGGVNHSPPSACCVVRRRLVGPFVLLMCPAPPVARKRGSHCLAAASPLAGSYSGHTPGLEGYPSKGFDGYFDVAGDHAPRCHLTPASPSHPRLAMVLSPTGHVARRCYPPGPTRICSDLPAEPVSIG